MDDVGRSAFSRQVSADDQEFENTIVLERIVCSGVVQ